MDAEPRTSAASDISMDRRIIRVDIPPAHAGITAALRRAFSAQAHDACERDFSDLLRRLN
jgi:DNA topoisomerase IB